MTTASAKYIITADDQTQKALASVKRGFSDMDRSINQSARALKGLFAVITGVSVMAGFRKVVQANADASKEFATALDGVKSAARNLLVSKDGISGVTAQLNELTKVLKDPATIAAADQFFSTMIKGAAKVVTGWGYIGLAINDVFGKDTEDELNQKIERTAQKMIKLQAAGRTASYEYIKLNSELTKLRGTLASIPDAPSAVPELDEVVVRGTRGGKETGDGGKFDRSFDGLRARMATAEEVSSSVRDALEDTRNAYEDVNKLLLEATDGVLEKTQGTFQQMSVFADEAARNMQTALADFLFDPFADGLDGMLKGFIDVIRRMVAEAAASKIFDMLGGVGGVGGLLGGFGKFLGFASGGSFKVGGSGGTDSQLVAFKATPGEMVDVRTPGQSRGGAVSVSYNIDARGATQELARALPGILKAHGESLKADLIMGIRRGKYAV